MLKTLGIVEVRWRTSRPATKIDRRLGGKSVLEWVVRRATDCQRLDGVLVVLGSSPAAVQVAELVPRDVPVYLGHEPDVLSKFVGALKQHPAQAVVRICADTPFVDPVLIDRLVSTADAHPNCDYISHCSGDGRPTILSHIGMFAEWCAVAALRRADREAQHAKDRQDVTRYLYSHPEKFNVRLIPAPSELDRHDVRLKVDLEEDWEHAQAIYDALGSEEWDWQRIAGLLDSQPAMRQKMALLNRSEVQR